jgi:hypothetical protein
VARIWTRVLNIRYILRLYVNVKKKELWKSHI